MKDSYVEIDGRRTAVADLTIEEINGALDALAAPWHPMVFTGGVTRESARERLLIELTARELGLT